MAHEKKVEEVSIEEEDSFSNDQWELAYSTLLEKYKKMKHDNKSLKRKIELYVHDSSLCFECGMFKEKIKKLNDKDASLVIEISELKSHVS